METAGSTGHREKKSSGASEKGGNRNGAPQKNSGRGKREQGGRTDPQQQHPEAPQQQQQQQQQRRRRQRQRQQQQQQQAQDQGKEGQQNQVQGVKSNNKRRGKARAKARDRKKNANKKTTNRGAGRGRRGRHEEREGGPQLRRKGGIAGISLRAKVTVRRLPACFWHMSQFLEQLADLLNATRNGEGLQLEEEMRFLRLIPGKPSVTDGVPPRPATAILAFSDERLALLFCKIVDGAEFLAKPLAKQEDSSPEEGEQDRCNVDGENPEDLGTDILLNQDSNPVHGDEAFQLVECTCDLAIDRKIEPVSAKVEQAKPDDGAASKNVATGSLLSRDAEFLGFIAARQNGTSDYKQDKAYQQKGRAGDIDGKSPEQSALLKFMLEKSRRKVSRRGQQTKQTQQKKPRSRGANKASGERKDKSDKKSRAGKGIDKSKRPRRKAQSKDPTSSAKSMTGSAENRNRSKRKDPHDKSARRHGNGDPEFGASKPNQRAKDK